MDIIPAAGAVGRIPVPAVHGQFFAQADRRLRQQRHEIVRTALRILSDQTGLVRTDRIKIPQQDHAQLRVRFRGVLEDLLDHRFRPAVRVRAGAAGHRLGVRRFIGFAVDRRRGRKHDILHARVLHALEDRERRVQIIPVIADRLLDGLSDRLQSRIVDHAENILIRENLRNGFMVCRVAFDHSHGSSRDLFDPPDRFRRGIHKIIQDRNVIAGIQKLDGAVRADKPGSAA